MYKNPMSLILLLLAGYFLCGDLYAQQWVRSYRSARKQALSQNKKLFLFFSGSDWCMEGRKMQSTLFRSKAFRDLTREKYVLYNADFPRQKMLGQEAREYNQRLASRYGITHFPAIVLADPRHGTMLVKHVGSKELSPSKLLETLETAAGLRKKKPVLKKTAVQKVQK